jgi:hypothetical protein
MGERQKTISGDNQHGEKQRDPKEQLLVASAADAQAGISPASRAPSLPFALVLSFALGHFAITRRLLTKHPASSAASPSSTIGA